MRALYCRTELLQVRNVLSDMISIPGQIGAMECCNMTQELKIRALIVDDSEVILNLMSRALWRRRIYSQAVQRRLVDLPSHG